MPLKNNAKTKTDVIREILRCGNDPAYFIKNYVKIQEPVQGLIPFGLFDYQEDVLDALIKHRLNIILKGRQLGFTTLFGAFIAWFILFHKDKNVLIVSTKIETAKTTMRIVRNALKFIPKELMIARFIADNKTSIELDNGSRVKAITTSGDAGRSEAVSLLFVDEVAHIDHMEEVWTGIWPTISTGGRAILSSTPNGTANFFYRQFKQAQAYENSFNCRFGTYTNPDNPEEIYSDRFMWWVHPKRSLEWFRVETKGKTAREIAQEYCCNFNTSGDTYLPAQTLQMMQLAVREPIERTFDDFNLWIWKQPERHGVYIIACDVASGFADDYTAFHVIRIDSQLEQVAEYKGKIPADILGDLLMRVSKSYNNATIAPENNSGWAGQAILKIQDAGYPFLYFSPRHKGDVIDPYNTHQTDEAQAGYRVTAANRIAMLSKMEQYIRNNDIQLYSQRTLDEFQQFIWQNGKPVAARMANDDLVMALAGGIWIREESFMATYRNVDFSKALLTGISSDSIKANQVNNMNLSEESRRNKNLVVLSNGKTIDVSRMIWVG